MNTIEIGYALANSPIPSLGFVADGTWTTDNGNPPLQITCKLVQSAGGDINSTGTTVNANGTWRAPFPGLAPGSKLLLHAKFVGSNTDEQANLRVASVEDTGVFIDELPELPFHWDEAVEYQAKGKYNGGIGIVCLAVTMAGKKLKSIDTCGAAVLDPKNKKWKATLQLDPVAHGHKVTIVALLVDEYGMVQARSMRRSPPRP